jgi:uncharacterized protein YgfB (UPF0149 family)
LSNFSEQLWNLPDSVPEWALHGAVCGVLCGAPDLSVAGYRRALNDLLVDVGDVHEDELARFIEMAADDLASPDLEFEPLLGELDAPLDERLRNLAGWAGSFIDGFEEASGELDDEALEAFEDIRQIADLDGEGVDEEAEFDYLSVCEHLKAAVLMVHAVTHRIDEDDAEEADDES